MNLSLMAKVLWAAGVFWNAALFLVLLLKCRYKLVPWFMTWIGFGLLDSLALFLVYRFGSKHLYSDTYWSGAFVDLILQVAVILELARSALRRGGHWVEGAKSWLLLMGTVGPLAAFLFAWLMTPAAETALDAMDARANLFVTILVCSLFCGVVGASLRLGLGWRDHVMREGYGLIVWTLGSFAADTLHSYWRTANSFSSLEYLRIIVFQGVSIYWAIALWLPEKKPMVVPERAITRLEAVSRRL